MSGLGTLETLLAGVWLGAYLFTTFVVSPALRAFPWAERTRVRSAIGRRYGKLAAPLLGLWFLLLSLQGLTPETLPRLVLLLALALLSGLHAALGARMGRVAASATPAEPRLASLARRSAWLTHAALGLSLALALLAPAWRGP